MIAERRSEERCAHFDLLAQGGKSTISGRVTDQSGAVLQGAQISLAPKGAVFVSNVQGQFFINNLDPGSYTITVSYVGFESQTKTVETAAGKNATADAIKGTISAPLLNASASTLPSSRWIA